MALNIELILKHTGETIEDFAENIGISTQELENYSRGTKASTEIYSRIDWKCPW